MEKRFLIPRGQSWFDGVAYKLHASLSCKVSFAKDPWDCVTIWEGMCVVPHCGYLAYVRAWRHPEIGIDFEEKPLQFNLG